MLCMYGAASSKSQVLHRTSKVKIDHGALFLNNMSNRDFRDMLEIQGVIDELVFILFEPIARDNEAQKFGKLTRNELKSLLRRYLTIIDKRHFGLLRDRQLSFDQVRARLDALHHDTHYKVLEDFKDRLPSDIYNAGFDEEYQTYFNKIYNVTAKNKDVPVEMILAKKQPHQTNETCLRSLYKNVKKTAGERNNIKIVRDKTKTPLVTGMPLDKSMIKLKKKLNFISEQIVWKLSKEEREWCKKFDK